MALIHLNISNYFCATLKFGDLLFKMSQILYYK